MDYNLDETLRLARVAFAARPAAAMAEAGGAVLWEDGGGLTVHCLGREVRVAWPEGRAEAELDPREEILLLHYLARATGVPPAGRYVAFRELPGGAIYADPFRRRAVLPLVAAFGERPERLLPAAARLGGEPHAVGDAAAVIPALPRVPLLLLIRAGDEEFAASGNVLFDATVSAYLPTEDCAQLAQLVVERLRRVRD